MALQRCGHTCAGVRGSDMYSRRLAHATVDRSTGSVSKMFTAHGIHLKRIDLVGRKLLHRHGLTIAAPDHNSSEATGSDDQLRSHNPMGRNARVPRRDTQQAGSLHSTQCGAHRILQTRVSCQVLGALQRGMTASSVSKIHRVPAIHIDTISTHVGVAASRFPALGDRSAEQSND
jgi:hypothetical protein